jgi:hypothetical protein
LAARKQADEERRRTLTHLMSDMGSRSLLLVLVLLRATGSAFNIIYPFESQSGLIWSAGGARWCPTFTTVQRPREGLLMEHKVPCAGDPKYNRAGSLHRIQCTGTHPSWMSVLMFGPVLRLSGGSDSMPDAVDAVLPRQATRLEKAAASNAARKAASNAARQGSRGKHRGSKGASLLRAARVGGRTAKKVESEQPGTPPLIHASALHGLVEAETLSWLFVRLSACSPKPCSPKSF